MMENIYIRRGGKIVGPTSLDNITRLWQNGKFKDIDEVSFNQKNWHPLGEFLKNNIQETAEVYEEENFIPWAGQSHVDNYLVVRGL
jgi:hypothetical protein